MTAPTRTGRGRQLVVWGAVAAGLVLIAVLGGRPSSGVPFDPESRHDSGMAGLRELLGELGADVEVVEGEVTADADVVAVLEDGLTLSEDQARSIDDALARGATVVVSDPFSPYTPPIADSFSATQFVSVPEVVAPGSCDIDAFEGIGAVEVISSVEYATDEVDGRCYQGAEGSFATVTRQGDEGVVVGFGGSTPFTNEFLGEQDNAALIAAVLVPRPGVQVQWVRHDPDVAVTTSPLDTLAPSTRQALVQLVVAFLVLALARGRRLGRPVTEPLPTRVSGSELVVAVGDLLQRTRDPARAVAILREQTRWTLCERLGLPLDSAPDVVADAAAARAGLDHEEVHAVLADRTVSDDDALVRFAQRVAKIRQEVLHGHDT